MPVNFILGMYKILSTCRMKNDEQNWELFSFKTKYILHKNETDTLITQI